MLVEEALNLVMRGNAGLTALVSARIYPGVLTQAVTYPAIAYRLVDREHVSYIEGRQSSGLARSRFRFFCTSKGINAYSDAKRLDEALRLCLSGYHGTVADTGSPVTTLNIHNIAPLSTIEFYDDPTQTWQVASDYDVWAEEARPT